MELQQLRYVLAVAEERNFTRAAQKCHVVQSALSHQVKALEQEIGTLLFARTSRRVELTEAGHAFLPSARATLDAADRAIADALAATGEISGKLTLGIIPTVTGIDLAAALGEFHRQHPAVEISLSVGNSNEFISSIREGETDVALLGLPTSTSPEKVSSQVIKQERLVAVLAPEHPLAKYKEVFLADLADQTFADFPAGSPGRAQSDLAFASADLSRRVTFALTSIELILDLITQNLAIALLAPAVIPEGKRLVTVPVVNGPTRTEYLAWSDFNPSPATLTFLKIVQSQLKE